MSACEEIARAYRDGTGVSRDPARAALYFGIACDAGRAEACAEQAQAMRRLQVKTSVEAAELVELRACVLRHGPSCAALVQRHPVPDLTRRRVIARAVRACEDGGSAACYMLGHLAASSRAARKSGDAVAFYQRACDLDLGWGCLALGRAYDKGRGVKRDRARARALLGQACALDPYLCPRRRANR